MVIIIIILAHGLYEPLILTTRETHIKGDIIGKKVKGCTHHIYCYGMEKGHHCHMQFG